MLQSVIGSSSHALQEMTIKSLKFFAIAFALLFTLPTKAETPFVLESAWVVGHNNWLPFLQ